MSIEVLQENLGKSLTTVSRVVSSRPSLPIIGNILLATEKGRLKVEATNLETTVTVFIGAKILKEGEFTVPARTFTELITSLPVGKISLILNEGQLLVKSGGFSAKVNGISPLEWPKPPTFKNATTTFDVATKDFLAAITQTTFAAATDDGRPALTGALFTRLKEKLFLIATDGFRLSKVLFKDGFEKFGADLIVPAKSLLEAARIIASEEKVTLIFSPNWLVFLIGETRLTTRLIEGAFPDFSKIIPITCNLTVEVAARELLRAVKTAGIFARENANIVKFKISAKGGQANFKITSAASQLGENELEVDAKIMGDQKEEFVTAFNFHYLVDLLTVLGETNIVLEFTTAVAPGVFKIKENPDFLHLVMPVRLQS